MSRINVLKLQSGEDIIGRVHAEDSNFYYMSDVLTMFYRMDNPSNGPTVYMSKYCMYSASYEVNFNKMHVVSIHDDISPHVVEYYEEILAESKKSLSFVRKNSKNSQQESLLDELAEYLKLNKKEIH